MNNGNQVQSNSNSFFGIKVSTPGINVNNATDAQLQYLNNYSQEIFYANGAANVLIGSRPANASNGLANAEEGFFVAEPGIDVRSATDDELVFNSQQNVFKIIKITGEVPAMTFAGGSAGVQVAIPHLQPSAPLINIYVPAQFLDFVTDTVISSTFIPLPILSSNLIPSFYYFPSASGDDIWPLFVSYGVDDTNVYVQAYFENSNSATGDTAPIPVTFFILQETIQS